MITAILLFNLIPIIYIGAESVSDNLDFDMLIEYPEIYNEIKNDIVTDEIISSLNSGLDFNNTMELIKESAEKIRLTLKIIQKYILRFLRFLEVWLLLFQIR